MYKNNVREERYTAKRWSEAKSLGRVNKFVSNFTFILNHSCWSTERTRIFILPSHCYLDLIPSKQTKGEKEEHMDKRKGHAKLFRNVARKSGKRKYQTEHEIH